MKRRPKKRAATDAVPNKRRGRRSEISSEEVAKPKPDRRKKKRSSKRTTDARRRVSAAAEEAFVKKAKTSIPEGATIPFEGMGLAEPVFRAISEAGYVNATPIQADAIPVALAGRDILGCAQTGTGKTAAFSLPILSKFANEPGKSRPRQPQALVLAPTRELAAQIEQSVNVYGNYLRLRSVVVFGGVGQAGQVRALERGVHILIATPGRLIDLMDQGYIDLSGLSTFVLDEADRMMDMGFLPALKRIISELPAKRQSLFFSATISPAIAELSSSLLTDPVSIDVTPPERNLDLIEQSVQFVRRADKQEKLAELLAEDGVGQAVVFTRTKRGANAVAKSLVAAGINADAIHGNKTQNARTRTLNGFRAGQVQVLVATDIAARGLDIDDVTHVVNYEMPIEAESYVHRIGRTGRAGANGMAISLCDGSEKDYLREIEKLIGESIPVIGEDSVGYEPAKVQRQARARKAQAHSQRRSGSASGSSPRRGKKSDQRQRSSGAGGAAKPRARRQADHSGDNRRSRSTRRRG